MATSSPPLGPEIDSTPAPRPQRTTISGSHVTIAPLDPKLHSAALYQAVQGHDDLWTYLFAGPFSNLTAFETYLAGRAETEDPLAFAIVDNQTGFATGSASYMRIEPVHRVIEIGSILFSPRLQRTRAATEAMYLMARHAFEVLGYRRYEWKCNALNAASRKAARRLGFTFEGIFRQHYIVKGRSRDTAWFAILDSEWPARKANFERWLDPSNFDTEGRQKLSLAALNHAVD